MTRTRKLLALSLLLVVLAGIATTDPLYQALRFAQWHEGYQKDVIEGLRDLLSPLCTTTYVLAACLSLIAAVWSSDGH